MKWHFSKYEVFTELRRFFYIKIFGRDFAERGRGYFLSGKNTKGRLKLYRRSVFY